MYIIEYKDEDHYYYITGEGDDNNNDNNDNYIIDRTYLHTNRVRCFIRNHESLSMLG